MKLNGFKLIGLITIVAICSCSSPTKSKSNVSGHNVKKGGVYHKTGLSDPINNCVECHGDDLKGGSSETSCYKCHGKKW